MHAMRAAKMLALCALVVGAASGLVLAGSALTRVVAGGDVSTTGAADTVPRSSEPPVEPVTAAPTLPGSGDPEQPSSAPGSLAPPVTPTVTPVAAAAAVARDVVGRLNDERTLGGLTSLTPDPTLERLAAEWAETMASRGYVHSPQERLSEIITLVDAGAVGENIHAPEPQCGNASGCAAPTLQPTSGVLHVDWMRSSRHRDAMLDTRWDRVGAGVFCDKTGRMWAVVLFASPAGVRVNPPSSTPYREPAVPGNGGATCQGAERDHSDAWVHPSAS
jgi:uncharacterized protein YkwD